MPGQPRRSAFAVSLWRDLLLAAGMTVIVGLFAASIELQERIFQFTRSWEWSQLDEVPAAITFFALCMLVLYARRHAQLRRALAENRDLMGRIIEVQEEERQHLARELHDELGQYLNAIKLDAQALVADGGGENQQAGTRRIAASADHVYNVAGNLVRRLRPPALDDLGLVAALEACVDTWRRSHPALKVQLSTGGKLDDLGEKVNLAIYRIVQEALTNCVKHARAGRMSIDLTRTPDPDAGLLLEIQDDGIGLPVAASGAGGGLTGMRERAVVLGGSFDLLSDAGRGVTIHVEIPLGERNQ
jgi:two-component system, NarL family, sensor histidine kinase UhpB